MTVKNNRAIILFRFFSIMLALSLPLFLAQTAFCDEFIITATARDGGKIIAPDGSEIIGPSSGKYVFEEGSSAEFRFEPDTSKNLSDIVLDSFSLGPLDSGSHTFTSITASHEIIGIFADDGTTIPESAGDDQIFKSDVPLSKSFEDMISKGVSYTNPVISVDSMNGAQNSDNLYMSFFSPVNEGQWHGNIKKYKLAYVEREDCTGREGPELAVVDKYGDLAVDCEGNFLESSISFWSYASDGGVVHEGSAGQLLLDSLIEIDTITEVNQYHSIRNIKTYLADPAGSIIDFNRANITKDDLGVEDDKTRDRVINYIYGYSFDADLDGRPLAKREWILGDIIHSEPEIMDYFDPETGDLQYRFIAAGANDGMLHVFTDTAILIGAKAYSPGEEIFAFIPSDLLLKLNTISTPYAPHTHMVDGSPNLYRHDTTDASSGYLNKTLVFGERRGGRSYWALDVTNPDPATWTVRWHIRGGAGGITTPLTKQIDELGYTWNKPFFTELKISESEKKNVMIFGGGYDSLEDGFPEAFLDNNYNGSWDTDEAYAVTIGGTEGYDKYNPSIDGMGRGIFVVDMDDGSLLFRASYNDGVEKMTGVAQTYNTMKYCFPADISIIPFSESRLLMYAADIYGQIWKIKYDYYADTENSYENDLSARWSVKRIFTANPGSDIPSGTGDGLVEPFTDSDPSTPDLDKSDQGRKTFYSPDISYYGNEWTNRPVLYFGTGDRAHPRYTMISNRFYAIADNDFLTYETDLLNLTCNELDINADADNDEEESDKADHESIRRNLKELLKIKIVSGFYRIMDQQGACKDSSTDHKGEHILSQPTLFNGTLYFTSYQPVLGDPSNPTGNVFQYALDYSFGTSALNYSVEEMDDYDPDTLEDTFFKISDSLISSGVKVISRGGGASGLISVGGKIKGVAEDRSMEIPGPSGGISQMLWEIEEKK